MKCNLLLILFLFSATAMFAGKDGEKLEKKITKTFSISSNGTLLLDNKYGAIDIAIGKSNSIQIDIQIQTEASSVKKAQEMMDRIQIEFSEGLNRVEAKTIINANSGWSSWFGSDKLVTNIDYKVLVPADIFLKIKNEYGDVYIEKTDRDLNLDIAYGDIRIGNVGANLILHMDYSDGAISQIKNGVFQINYSDLHMENAAVLDIKMQYTDLIMGSANVLTLNSAYSDIAGMDVDEVTYKGKYDGLKFDRVKKITADAAYTDITLNGLDQSGDFDIQYGELNISNITRNFTRLDINSSYAGVAVAFALGTNFMVDVQGSYCDIIHRDLHISEQIEKMSSHSLKGSRGPGGGLLYARMNYGEINIR